MTTPATTTPSAPSTPAPAAPAAGGSSDTPSWGGGDVGAFMAGVTSNAPAASAPPAPTPPVTPPTTAPATAPAASAPAPEGAPAQPAAPTEPAQPAPGEPTPAAAPAEPPKPAERLLAGRFKTTEELERAYDSSGQEARRLYQATEQSKVTIQKLQADLDARQTELEVLKLEQQIGPEPKEPTAEEMATWNPAQVAKYYADKTERNTIKRDIERQKKELDARKNTTKAEVERETAKRQDDIRAAVAYMASQSEKFPRFNELADTMGGFLKMEPGLVGLLNTPIISYLAAYGHQALQRDLASQEATSAAAEAARVKANASAAAAGGSGGAGGPAPAAPQPASATPQPGSDAEHNARLIEAHTGSRPMLPVD